MSRALGLMEQSASPLTEPLRLCIKPLQFYRITTYTAWQRLLLCPNYRLANEAWHGQQRVWSARGTRMTTEAELRIQDVSKYFGGVQAIGRVSLAVSRGEIVSIIGPNGAGKTTLLNMVSGFYHPDGGAIWLNDRDITHLAPSRIAALGIARTFQNIALFRGMTVLDNLMLGRHTHMRACPMCRAPVTLGSGIMIT